MLGVTELWTSLPVVVQIVMKIVAIMLPLMILVAYYTYAERKVIGAMQVRNGPNRVGFFGMRLWGLGQPIADAVKLMFKEIILPSGANKLLFLIAPMLSIAPALAAWAVLPFTDTLVLANIDASLLYILALTSIGLYAVIIAGWAADSKYAFLSTMRSAAQIVAYEIAMGFALVGVLMAAGSLNLGKIIQAQSGGIFNWFWLPLMPLFLIYFISGVAETNRAPFDVAEGESEIVAGFHVEYSGMPFAVFFLGEYANMILISALTALLFLASYVSVYYRHWFTEDKTPENWTALQLHLSIGITIAVVVAAGIASFRYQGARATFSRGVPPAPQARVWKVSAGGRPDCASRVGLVVMAWPLSIQTWVWRPWYWYFSPMPVMVLIR